MIPTLRRAAGGLARHRYGLTLATFLAAAVASGVASVWFMWAFEFAMSHRLSPARVGWLSAVTTPAMFLLSVWLVRRFAPAAEGSGIPQVAFAAEHMKPGHPGPLADLVSLRTMGVKAAALLLALVACASSGREGPTVHVAACAFVAVVLVARRYLPVEFDVRSAVVAGGSAGLAAAFNTPLAGVTFAIEELGSDYFVSIKDYVLLAIIVAAVAAKSLTGEYTYFGRLTDPAGIPFGVSVLIGAAGGLLGAFFSSAILAGGREMRALPSRRRTAMIALFSLLILALSLVSGEEVLGPGNGAARSLVRGEFGVWALGFPAAKLASTLLTYWSGIAGGIFAPCLSIGAALGADLGRWLSQPTATCAMVGMAAFLAGTIQAPITSFVIIFEMTGHHEMLLPVMTGALVAYMAARVTGARHLYRELARGFEHLDAESR